MASQNTAHDIRAALNDSNYNRLPLELRGIVEEDVPVLHAENQLARLRALLANRQNNPQAHLLQSSKMPQGDPRIPPKDGTSPFLHKLPPEIRRLIFLKYIFPSKAQSIEPVQQRKRREAYLRKRGDFETMTRRSRNTHQQQSQNFLQGNLHWQNQLLNPLPNLQLPLAPPGLQPQQPGGQVQGPQAAQFVPLPAAMGQVPFIQNGPPQASFLGVPPPTGNPLTWQGNPLLNNPLQPALGGLAPNPLYQSIHAPPPPNIAAQLAALQATLTTGLAPAPPAPTPHIPSPQVAAVEETKEEKEARRQKYRSGILKIRKYDDTPEKLIVSLMLTNSKLCFEIASIMYEEYTFEVHLHFDGVELLGFERIPTLENWGVEIEKTMGAFKSERPFCFQRMKHLDFVFFGCSPKNRLAGLRMRESARKLVDLLKKEKKPLSSVKVSFRYEKKNEMEEEEMSNVFTDALGNFWTAPTETKREPRTSIIHDVYNVQLVSAPLKALRGVSTVTFKYPEGIEADKKLADYTTEVTKLIKAKQASYTEYEEMVREEMIMDARRDKELQLAGAGGYYKPGDLSKPGDGIPVSEFLVDEEELEEDGLEQPFVITEERSAMRDLAHQWHIADEQEDVEMFYDVVENASDAAIREIPLRGHAILPAGMPQAGSLNIRDETDVEQSNILMHKPSPSKKQKRTAVVEEDEATIFGKYIESEK